MSETMRSQAPWIFWPFAALWDLIAFVLELTGRLLGVLLGLFLMIVGVLLTVTVIGAPIGIPLAVVGFLLVLRGLF